MTNTSETESAVSDEKRPRQASVLPGFVMRAIGRTFQALGLGELKRGTWLQLSAVLAAISIVCTLWVQRDTVPDPPPKRWSATWFDSPVEFNTWRKLPAFENAALNAVAVLPGGRVFVGGENGLLAYSDDEGRNWISLRFDTPSETFVAPSGATRLLPQVEAPPAGGAGETNAGAANANGKTVAPSEPVKGPASNGPSRTAGSRPSSGAARPPTDTTNQGGTAQRGSQSASPVAPTNLIAIPDGQQYPSNNGAAQQNQVKQVPNQQRQINGPAQQQQQGPPNQQQQQNPSPQQPEPKKKNLAQWWDSVMTPRVAYAAVNPTRNTPPANQGNNNAAASGKVQTDSVKPSGSWSDLGLSRTSLQLPIPSTYVKNPPTVVALLNLGGGTLEVDTSDLRSWMSTDGGINWEKAKLGIFSISDWQLATSDGSLPSDDLFTGWMEPQGQRRAKVLAAAKTNATTAAPLGRPAAKLELANGTQLATAYKDGAKSGTILSRSSAKDAWKAVMQVESVELRDIGFSGDGQLGYAAGSTVGDVTEGAIFQTKDAGSHWAPVTQAAAAPADTIATRKLEVYWQKKIPIVATILQFFTRPLPAQSYWKLPAPWVLSLLTLGVGCLLLGAVISATPGADTLTDVAEWDWEPAGDTTAPKKDPVANITVSDRPLEPEDLDVLGFGPIARGISGFLRNPKTLLPVTIAINGAWGLGKSSMMNLIERDLGARGFRPMAFNAWHHQEDENLLASFLQSVKEDAAPPVTSWSGLGFRMRLGWQRLGRFYPRALGMLAIALILAGAEYSFREDTARGKANSLQQAISSIKQQLDNLVTSVKKEGEAAGSTASPGANGGGTGAPPPGVPAGEGAARAPGGGEGTATGAAPANKNATGGAEKTRTAATGKTEQGAAKKSPEPPPVSSLVALLIGLLANVYGFLDLLVRPAELVVGHGAAQPLTALYVIFRIFPSALKRLRAFSEDPSSLLQTSSPGATPKQLEAQTSFRMKFGREFHDVTQALGNKHRLVIFIDDLDRCRPAKVAEMLEAVNYIVVSGECAVVLGLETRAIKASIGLSFNQVAEELYAEEADSTDLLRAAEEKRNKFAVRYIEKLINIEINVPTPSPEQKRRMLVERESKDRQKQNRRSRQVATATAWMQRAAMLAFVLGVAWGIGMGSVRLAEWRATAHYDALAEKKAPAQTTADNGGTGTAQSTPPLEAPANQKPANPTAPQAQPATQNAAVGMPVIATGQSPYPGAFTQGWMRWIVLPSFAMWILQLLTRVPQPMSQDSDLFTETLGTWGLVAGARLTTPRALKRFLNRVRCLAMLQHPPERKQSRLQRWLAPLPPSEPVERVLDEDVLVALASIEEYDPEPLTDRDKLGDFLRSTALRETGLLSSMTIDNNLIQRLKDGRERYLDLKGGVVG